MKRWLAFLLLATGLAAAQAAPRGVLTLRFLDVGQGDAVLITAPEGQSGVTREVEQKLTLSGEEGRFNSVWVDIQVICIKFTVAETSVFARICHDSI